MTADVVVPLVVVSGFAVFSVLGLFFATRVGRSMSRFARVARPTTGRIVSTRSVPGQQRPLDHYPVLRFRLPDGEEVETVSFATTSRRRASGESVVVMYDPDDPQKAALKGTYTTSGVAIGCIAAVVAAVALTILAVAVIAAVDLLGRA